jgi:transcriptional regulator GlxA family with amidase domain
MRVAILAFPGCQILDVIGPLEVFAEVNRQTGRDIYQVEIVSNVAGQLLGCSGISLVPTRAIHDPIVKVDTLLVAGGPDIQSRLITTGENRWIVETAADARRYGSICSGAFIMAQTGLLSGRRVTTHWSKAENLAQRYPDIILEPDAIFICDGPVCTSAGVTAGIDLALALVEDDCGRDVALKTARELVVNLKRTGGQSQFGNDASVKVASSPVIAAVCTWLSEHLDGDLSMEALATRAQMSARNFSRIFLKEIGVTPHDFVETKRIELARKLITTDVSLQTVAEQSGFGTIANLRRAFARRLMTTPRIYRDNFGKGK